MPRDVALHQLEGFYWVGREGGYAPAARAMPRPISEPAIHQQIRKLEAAIGVRLCVQAAPRRTILTPEGRLLHDFVAPFFESLPAVLASARRREARLVVAVAGPVARDLAIASLPAFRRARPGIEVRLVDAATGPEVGALVADGTADAGIASGGPVEGLVSRPLTAVPIELVLPGGHPLAGIGRNLEAADLDGLPLCAPEAGTADRDRLEAAFAAAGATLAVAAESRSLEALEALVAAGVGPAFLPVGPGGPRLPGLTAVAVAGLAGPTPTTYDLLTRPIAPPDALADFLDLLAGPTSS